MEMNTAATTPALFLASLAALVQSKRGNLQLIIRPMSAENTPISTGISKSTASATPLARKIQAMTSESRMAKGVNSCRLSRSLGSSHSRAGMGSVLTIHNSLPSSETEQAVVGPMEISQLSAKGSAERARLSRPSSWRNMSMVSRGTRMASATTATSERMGPKALFST